jgi:1-acyl-sn-glycerol-3-phosphate acyltransferase
MKFVMTVLAGAIAKSKNRSDMVTLSRMKLLTETGCVIGVYQEGERSWDGVNLPPVKGTDKLIRFLKIPVVYAHLEGAYLDHPRWSWSGNRTAIKVRYELLINPDEIDRMSLGEIARRLDEAGTYNEWTYQEKASQPLLGEKRAENCELVCFLCPGCQSVNTIRSAGNDFQCSHCGLGGSINRLGSFDWDQPPEEWPEGRSFDNIRDWNLWQINFYKKKTDEINGEIPHLFWEDRGTVFLSRGNRHRQMEHVGLGSARFFSDRIEFESAENTIIMPLDSITSFSVFKQFFTEFYYNKTLYRFSFSNRSVSGYKWLMLYRMITEKRAICR